MSRIAALDPTTATGKVHDLFTAVKGKLGMVPNLMRSLGHSPAALEGYLSLNGALGGGSLSAKDRERIALTVAEANGCDYCLAAHSALGKMAGLTPDQIRASRLGADEDAKTDALLRFARQVVETRGKVSDGDVTAVRAAGYSDGDITEIVANVALNVLTNYFNNAAHTDIDFPKAASLADKTTCAAGCGCGTK